MAKISMKGRKRGTERGIGKMNNGFQTCTIKDSEIGDNYFDLFLTSPEIADALPDGVIKLRVWTSSKDSKYQEKTEAKLADVMFDVFAACQGNDNVPDLDIDSFIKGVLGKQLVAGIFKSPKSGYYECFDQLFLSLKEGKQESYLASATERLADHIDWLKSKQATQKSGAALDQVLGNTGIDLSNAEQVDDDLPF